MQGQRCQRLLYCAGYGIFTSDPSVKVEDQGGTPSLPSPSARCGNAAASSGDKEPRGLAAASASSSRARGAPAHARKIPDASHERLAAALLATVEPGYQASHACTQRRSPRREAAKALPNETEIRGGAPPCRTKSIPSARGQATREAVGMA